MTAVLMAWHGESGMWFLPGHGMMTFCLVSALLFLTELGMVFFGWSFRREARV
eukprot:CAMPEP_0201867014 /NCGR_PEP_ID=MMETSP0902-20130614/1412_1 /ASSEMBLY_ACC=CAM_ASM_000551 /TAXON_ID=420261 /ORGANISM="Thalassiosira antarctica, Strain CCMP982" /LENGTH=52 /DNA_ID=CAMNT_0048392111 /DNA_START=83 /DNA_END=241 /DNA_ORIENTATION=-